MNVLSLFDGISCGRIALEKAGIPIDMYFASEIDKYAIQISEKNYPDTIQMGDVTQIRREDLPKINLLMGGSPCQGFSFAGKQLNFKDPRSKLFFEYVRLLKECKPEYFLLENVYMKKEYQQVITEALGVEPILINSSLVSAQNRKRLYWTNIPGIEQPGMASNGMTNVYYDRNERKLLPGRMIGRARKNGKRIGHKGSVAGKTKQVIELNKDQNKTNCVSTVQKDNILVNNDSHWRKLTPIECERLQTLPDDYTEGVSNTQRYKMLGNGWTVEVIRHIFSYIKKQQKEKQMRVYIDFEYNHPEERHPQLVCASWNTSYDPEIKHIWLYKNKENHVKLKHTIRDFHAQGAVFCSYAVTAEARCFCALMLDPTQFRWVDLYVEWRQLRNGNDKFNYGTYFTRNIKCKSVPPIYNKPHLNRGRDNTQLHFSLSACTGRLLETNIDMHLKKGMRDLILTAPEQFTQEEQNDILEYCDSDIVYLSRVRHKMTAELAKLLGKTEKQIEKMQMKRGEFSAHVAIMESIGIPLHMNSVRNLRKNVALAKEKLITDLVENYYPFFVRSKKKKSDLRGTWKDKYSNFAEFIETKLPKELAKGWKLTDSGRYQTDSEYLKTFENIPEISAYRQVKKQLNQLKWLRAPEEGKEDLFDSIGSDGRLRAFFGIYGTQTARNAPMAKKFIFAMSAWLRCLVRPPEEYVITELDYGSQEFAIGAVLSQDPNMIEAYKSGDPYLYFAKKAKAVPPDGTKKEYSKERNLFKATTLGLQYGMGKKSLAIKLSSDMGRKITEVEADKLIALHKKVYRVYWRWLKQIDREYLRKKHLLLPCGWALFGDNPSPLSVRNFPTQGGGSSIIREAVKRLKVEGITVIATLHDSCYILTRKDQSEKIELAEKIMIVSFNKILNQNDVNIRIDTCSHHHETPWISEKGQQHYELLKEYLEPQETAGDLKRKLMETIFK